MTQVASFMIIIRLNYRPQDILSYAGCEGNTPCLQSNGHNCCNKSCADLSIIIDEEFLPGQYFKPSLLF